MVTGGFLWVKFDRLNTDELSGDRFMAAGGGRGRFCFGEACCLLLPGLCGAITWCVGAECFGLCGRTLSESANILRTASGDSAPVKIKRNWHINDNTTERDKSD